MNPNNEDLFQVQATCLHRHGLAPVSFTGKDLERAVRGGESARSSLPFKLDDEVFERCLSDPMAG